MSNQAQPLAGRERELELLERCFEEACAGTPRFAFISGEPGIGKTRLLVELLDRADARGVLALRGSASEFERALPFGLLVGAIDEYLEVIRAKIKSEGVFPVGNPAGITQSCATGEF